MTVAKRAYYAGLFDGDGCVHIAHGGSIQKHPYGQRRVAVEISQCWVPVLRDLKEWYGGCISTRRRSFKNPNHRDYFVWSATARQAEAFICDILPYSVIKREQLELALEWQATCKPGYSTPQNVQHVRDELQKRISALKHETREFVAA